jgi:hypothetical protein
LNAGAKSFRAFLIFPSHKKGGALAKKPSKGPKLAPLARLAPEKQASGHEKKMDQRAKSGMKKPPRADAVRHERTRSGMRGRGKAGIKKPA